MQLTEFTLVSTDHEFKDGQLLEPNFNQHVGDMTNNIQVDCFDCEMEKTYSRGQILKGKAPKWIIEKYKQVTERPLKGD
jgi:hypothetical protein